MSQLVVSPARTRVLLALITVYQREGRATVRAVGDEAGLTSPNTTHRHLVALRDLGLVWWDPDRRGTLRPAVSPVGTHVRKAGDESTTIARELDDPRGVGAPGGLADATTFGTGEPST